MPTFYNGNFFKRGTALSSSKFIFDISSKTFSIFLMYIYALAYLQAQGVLDIQSQNNINSFYNQRKSNTYLKYLIYL